jgi:transposase
MVDHVEIVTRKERRRRWRDEERRRLVAEAFAPGAVVAHVARRNGVAESCLYTWRKRYSAADGAAAHPRLIPVVVEAAEAPAAPAMMRGSCGPAAVVVLPDGTRVEVVGGYPCATLKTLIAALRRTP